MFIIVLRRGCKRECESVPRTGFEHAGFELRRGQGEVDVGGRRPGGTSGIR